MSVSRLVYREGKHLLSLSCKKTAYLKPPPKFKIVMLTYGSEQEIIRFMCLLDYKNNNLAAKSNNAYPYYIIQCYGSQ